MLTSIWMSALPVGNRQRDLRSKHLSNRAIRLFPLNLWSTRYELAQDTCSIVPESGQLHLLRDTRS
jgi:hypothetical protein